MKKLALILAMALALCAGLVGCSAKEDPDNPVVIRVEKETVTLQEFRNVFNFYLEQYGITNENDAAYASVVDEIRSFVIDTLVNEKVQLIQARKEKLDRFSDEEKAAIQDSVDETIDTWRSYFRNSLSDTYADEAELETHTEQMLADYMKETGYSEQYLIASFEDDMALQKLYEAHTGEIAPTDEQVRAAYDEKLAADQAAYAADLAAYERDLNSMEDTIYFHPAGFRMVKQILISLPDEVQQELESLRLQGKDDEADAKRADALAAIEPKAQEILDSLAADGSNFDAVMAEKSEDPGSASQPEGYMVSAQSTMYVSAFTQAAMALTEVGQISGLVATDFGYHILYYSEELPERTVSFDEAQDALRESLANQMKNQAYDELLTGWREGMKIETFPEKTVSSADSSSPQPDDTLPPDASYTPSQSAEPSESTEPSQSAEPSVSPADSAEPSQPAEPSESPAA